MSIRTAFEFVKFVCAPLGDPFVQVSPKEAAAHVRILMRVCLENGYEISLWRMPRTGASIATTENRAGVIPGSLALSKRNEDGSVHYVRIPSLDYTLDPKRIKIYSYTKFPDGRISRIDKLNLQVEIADSRRYAFMSFVLPVFERAAEMNARRKSAPQPA